MTYLILQNPGHNRVYYNLSDKLALAELKITTKILSGNCTELKVAEIEGIRYLSFDVEKELSEADFDLISRLSFVFAIFKVDEIDNKIYFEPVQKLKYEYIDDKISSILKYQGKTNELFTKMMLNIALLSSDFSYSDKIKLLDPIAGKGTTLFEATIYGFDAYGIEIDQKYVQEVSNFFKKFIENERWKHSFEKRQIAGKKKTDAIFISEFIYSKNKADFKNEENLKSFGILNGIAQDAYKYFKKAQFHLIVGDLPYGIFHGNTTDKNSKGFTRNPMELLEQSLPEWNKILLKGGVIVVSWNTFVAGKQKIVDIFKSNDFEVFENEPYNDFQHLVDKSIKRDFIVAKKKGI